MSLQKRSITLHGHRTSVALEADFWQGLEELADVKGQTMAAMIAKIDDERDPDTGLSSCIRIAVLRFYREMGKSEYGEPLAADDQPTV
ncbi:aryl-sulfate sulfotransferase [Rhodobacteraceae bacterium RKSG542]|uniref:ribbon-helix-helix domain-containing protein n=1 Tax=Pseudovibrio flavus TaxID=2529854 RepID=UPI0012BB7266|nr:ribbon-helix-helix domain-containing protein [Pseudovibrio flavus]MTI19168.1 aryl-sulfate sulfotransferase [Pseudovibrio flavus]